jgi:hypothetical protein
MQRVASENVKSEAQLDEEEKVMPNHDTVQELVERNEYQRCPVCQTVIERFAG